MTSTVYRQSALNEIAGRIDPENRLYGRMRLRRYEAETLRDAILLVSGKLNAERFGPPIPIARDESGRVVTGNQKNNGNNDPVLVDPIGDLAFRRSIYVQVRRSLPLTVLDAFDAPIMSPNCEARLSSTVAPQSLTMLNDSFVLSQAQHFALRLRSEYPGDARSQVTAAWRLAYGMQPSASDISRSLEYLAEQAEQIRAKGSDTPPKNEKKSDNEITREPQALALASLCQALISANRFLYVD